MGLSLFGSNSARRLRDNTPAPADPRPNNFRINNIKQVNSFVVVDITYPNCTTFEGNKLLVFEGVSIKWIKSHLEIDPHFRKNWPLVARFKPDATGKKLLDRFVKNC